MDIIRSDYVRVVRGKVRLQFIVNRVEDGMIFDGNGTAFSASDAVILSPAPRGGSPVSHDEDYARS